jgi:hypothetical protein
VLGHLSRDCNEPELAVSVVRAALDTFRDVEVVAAREDEPLRVTGFAVPV